jgi:hypothetical protein
MVAKNGTENPCLLGPEARSYGLHPPPASLGDSCFFPATLESDEFLGVSTASSRHPDTVAAIIEDPRLLRRRSLPIRFLL